MKDFFSFPETGKLVIEKILFDAGYPILFTCTNQVEELYLGVCCQCNKDGRKWLLAETVPEVIIKLLSDRLTIREAFLVTNKKRFTIIQNDELILQADVPEDWDAENSIYLPDAGEYMEAEAGEFDEEIRFYTEKMKMEIFKKIITDVPVSGGWNFNVSVELENIKVDINIINEKETDIELKLPDLKEETAYRNRPEFLYAV